MVKIAFQTVSEHSGTIGLAFGYYYIMDKRLLAYVWGIAQWLEVWSTSTLGGPPSVRSHLSQECMLGWSLSICSTSGVVVRFYFKKSQRVGLLAKGLGLL